MRVQLNVVQGRAAPHWLQLECASVDEARAKAMALGYAVLSARAEGTLLATSSLQATGRQQLDVPVFVEQLRDLLQAGLSVVESLNALRRGARGSSAEVFEALERQLREGKTLSSALETNPIFPALLVALVKASEVTSDLPQALTRFLEHQKRAAEVRHRLISTAIYPALLIGVGGLVLLFLLFVVMPRFARVFEGMTGELPWSARAMLAWSESLHAYATWWIAAGCLLGIACMAALGSPLLRAMALRRALAWAPLRDRLKVYFLARWYRTTGMLVQGGIPLPESLALAHSLLPLALQPSGDLVEQGVRSGLSPSDAHTRAGMATPIAEQLLLAGERTGDLGNVLSRIAHYHEAEVSRSLERTMRALEPIVMVLIGVGVGIVVVLMYLPIFELASAIQ